MKKRDCITNNITEQSLIDNLLSDEDFNVDWNFILVQAKAENWQTSEQICQQIFKDYFCYSACDIKKVICFFASEAQYQIEILLEDFLKPMNLSQYSVARSLLSSTPSHQ